MYRAWKARAWGLRTMLFAQSVQDAFEFAKYFRDKGVEAQTITSETGEDQRKLFLDGLRAGTLPILCNYGVLQTGVDVPAVECIGIARNMGLGAFTQAAGRGTRPSEETGKDKLILLNLTDQHHTLSTMGDLFGRHMQAIPSLRGALREKLEEEVAKLPTEVKKALPEEVYARLRAVEMYKSNVFAGNGWKKLQGTSDWRKDSKWGTLFAEKLAFGYSLRFLHKSGRSEYLARDPIEADHAKALGQQYLVRRERREDMEAGNHPDLDKPITPRQLAFLRVRKIGGIPREDKDAYALLKQAHYIQAQKHLKEHKHNFTEEGGMMRFDERARTMVVRHFPLKTPKQRQESIPHSS